MDEHLSCPVKVFAVGGGGGTITGFGWVRLFLVSVTEFIVVSGGMGEVDLVLIYLHVAIFVTLF